MRLDGVGRRSLANVVVSNGEPGEDVAMLIEHGLELGLALTDAADRG